MPSVITVRTAITHGRLGVPNTPVGPVARDRWSMSAGVEGGMRDDP